MRGSESSLTMKGEHTMREYTFANPEYESAAGAIIKVYNWHPAHPNNKNLPTGPITNCIGVTNAEIFFDPYDWITRDNGGHLFTTW